MKRTLALIFTSGSLDLFSQHRSKAAMPFAGKYRLIDFSLSNCVNSGIENIGIITQHMPSSLRKHIGIGKPWDLDRKYGGITILQPHKGNPGSGWYQGAAEALYKNIRYLHNFDVEDILILPGNLVYKMDYNQLIKAHRDRGADLTIAANNLPFEEAAHYPTLDYDQEYRVKGFKNEINGTGKNKVSIGINVIKKDILLRKLNKYCSHKNVKSEEDFITRMIADQKEIYLYNFEGYLENIRTVYSYWKSNLEAAENLPKLNLYDNNWQIHTRSEEKPPAKFGTNSHINKSLISNGAIINGRVENSIISPGVYIEDGAFVTDSVILNNTVIGQNSLVNKTVIDKNTLIGANCRIGDGNDFTENNASENILKSGLNIIARDLKIADNITINRNCRIAADIAANDFENNMIKSGSTIK